MGAGGDGEGEEGGGPGGDDGDDADADDDDGDGVEPDDDMLSLLYHPQAVKTPRQKITQSVLLKAVIRQLYVTFNARFEKLIEEKNDVKGKIEGKNDRVKEILVELHGSADGHDYYVPPEVPGENPSLVLEVQDSEITVQKYISEAERKRLK